MKFNTKKYISDISTLLQKKVEGKTIIMVSGGVDSSTSAMLFKNAGMVYKPVFIDTGFLGMDESDAVKIFFGKELVVLNKRTDFYRALRGVKDSATKRCLFSKLYFDIIKHYLTKNNISNLVQGTQYYSEVTKKYHNLPTVDFLRLNVRIIEPVKGLSKEQIRAIAKELGMLSVVMHKRPFPGPGLLIRFGGEYTAEKVSLIRKITSVVDFFVLNHQTEFENCYQIFPYLAEDQATYVTCTGKGSNGYIVLLRAVKLWRNQTYVVYKPFRPPVRLENLLVKEIMKIEKVSRVCLDLTSKIKSRGKLLPGGTIEYL